MALSEDQKKKIEEEEAYRIQLREKIGSKAIPQPAKKGIGCLGWFLIIFIGFPVLISMILIAINPSKQMEDVKKVAEKSQKGGLQNNNTTPKAEKQNTFVASVNFTGTEFVISNLDKYTCQNARMQVNGDYELKGYTLESGLNSVTKSGEVTVYKVGAGQFTKGDGTRFNPYATKPQNFYIGCRGSNELSSAYWYGEF